ncbi:hypothetical protein DEO72_LG7g1107 [Vigna unguiculata]|uniref:Uncharacterized protein n=1 Tax=Vigna unguiculata TaxID=3917 RepID=A0A4D6MH16_VIGUN|nr:hypothetical protein DEO72_LG7g1107 [Vigna unguiculata]
MFTVPQIAASSPLSVLFSLQLSLLKWRELIFSSKRARLALRIQVRTASRNSNGVKPIGNGSAEQQRPPQVLASSESDLNIYGGNSGSRPGGSSGAA